MSYLSSGLKMFERNSALAKRIAAGAGRASGSMGNLAAAATARGFGRTGKAFGLGQKAFGLAQQYPRRAVGGAALGIGTLGLMGNGRRNNSTYQESNPYNY